MKNQHLNHGKKLNKKELRVITGGKEMCWLPNLQCSKISFSCAELQCQPILEMA
ncbi:bacteriocin [Chryseobacterium sp.]|uniref:bacteriocin n=1 Tax=Chryseobacterium sp. TaxID=1871047 RepID=UPI0025C1A61A|nr:bacteriocin [Chryseobacterium sp.]MBV8324930.1 bacteriocin [Chryseobacterium sp.]